VVYATTFRQWLEGRLVSRGGSVDRLKTALLRGDAEVFERQLQAFVTDVLSYHDPAVLDPEQVYQGFVLGLLATLEPEYQGCCARIRLAQRVRSHRAGAPT
jgi:hypothetical protein